MIGKKINQLATELAPVSTDLTIIGDPTTGVSKKITLAQLGAIFSGAVSFYTNLAGFPATGDINVIYCAKDTQKLYLWSGSAYVEVFPSQALLDTYQLRSEKGNANGYASLDSGGKVPISQLPSSIMEYKGTWNASTNTPTLANGTGDTGDVYICNVAGTVNFGAGPLTFAVGDYVIYSGTIWQRSSGAVGTVTSVSATITGDSVTISGSPLTTSGTLAFAFAGNSTQYINGAGNRITFPTLMTSVGLTMPSAFTVTNSPLTGAGGTLAVTGAGNATQYVRGDGQLATLPTNGGGGGASVSYYLNGSINQGTIGGVTYYEMNKTPIIGAGTDFSRSSNGYIASFLTDANDPALLNIPAGNFNFETYFEASSGGGSPTFYIELYKYDGTTFTLIASNSGSPKLINDGTNIEAYFSALAVPETTLTLTDRLAIRIYVTTAGRTITLHTENGHLCQVITTFTTGLTALNGLTAQVQYLATGTSGTDFNISSATATHTFNLPTASATNRGALASADWTTFNNKQNALNGTGFVKISGTTISYDNSTYYLASNPNAYIPLTALSAGAGISYNNTTGVIASTITQYTDANARAAISLTTTGTSGAATYNSTTGVLNVPQYAPDLSGYVPTNRTLTINGTAFDLSANRSWSVGTVTSVGLSSATSGVTIGSTPITTSGTITLAIATASGSQQGLLSSTDWTTFNNKQSALTNPVTGTGTTNYLPKFTGASTIGNSLVFDDGSGIRIGATSHALASNRRLTVVGASAIEAVATGTGGEPTIEMWQKHTAGDNVFAYFFTEAAATTRGYLQYDRSGNRLNLVGSGNGLLFTGAATFSSSITAGGDLTLNPSGNSTITQNASTGNYNQILFKVNGTTQSSILALSSALYFSVNGSSTALTIASTQAATFSNALQVAGQQAAANYGGTGLNFDFTSGNIGRIASVKTTSGGSQLQFLVYNTSGTDVNALQIASTGAATFSSSVDIGQSATVRGFTGTTGAGMFMAYGSAGAGIGSIYSYNYGTSTYGGTVIDGSYVAFYNSGSEKMRVTGGNVGIGTTSPTVNLDIENSTTWAGLDLNGASGGEIRLQKSGTTYGQLYASEGTSTGFVINAAGAGNDIYFQSNGSTKMTMLDSGNVGIGTTSPVVALDLGSSTDKAFHLYSSAGDYYGINMTQYDSVTYSTNIFSGNGGTIKFRTASGTSTQSTRMTISATGNVGIGTTSPSRALHVLSGGGTAQIQSTGTTSHMYFADANSSVIDNQGFGSVGNNLWFSAGGFERMRITSGGNVLIGTTTDSGYKLNVSGNGYFSNQLTAYGFYSTNSYKADGGYYEVVPNYATYSAWNFRFGAQAADACYYITGGGYNILTTEGYNNPYTVKLYSNSIATLTMTNGAATFSSTLGINGVSDNIKSGTYTPTLSSIYNVASSTAFVCQYMRVGNVVTVSGVINVTATATNTWTRISMTLPISSNFDFSYRAGGGGGANSTNNVCVILAGASTSVVYLDAYPNSTNSLSYYFSYTYQII